MWHSLFKSSMGGKKSRRHANWCSAISNDGTAVPAGVTLVPNQPEAWQKQQASWAWWSRFHQQDLAHCLGYSGNMEERSVWRISHFLCSVTWKNETGVWFLHFKTAAASSYMKSTYFEVNSQYFIERQLSWIISSASLLSENVDSKCVGHSMFEFVSCPACHVVVCVVSVRHILSEGPFLLKKMSETFSQAGLFILPLGLNSFPFTLSVPTGGRQDRHQVSTMNDNPCASAAS